MRKFFCSVLILSNLTLVALVSAPNVAPRATTSTDIYNDRLSAGWQDWSWGTTLDLNATTPVKSGARSLAVTFTEGWCGLYLHHDGVPIKDKKWLEFWIAGASSGGGQTISIYAEDATGRPVVQKALNPYIVGGGVAARAWRKVKVPLSDLALGSSPLTGLVFFNSTANAQSQFFLDQIQLVGDGTTVKPTPYATPTFGPTAPAYPQSTPMGIVPASLPNEFSIGIGNFNAEWMRTSGSKWQARYQYLVGGVNTADNWTTWNSPRGQFATDYLNESARIGVVPVFTYYQILQSNPRPYDESLPSYAEKFGNAATMKAYFDDFKLLLLKCRAFNQPVIIHVEPDVWGYMQRAQANPGNYAIKVAASGHADASGLANSTVGFAQMLARLRGRYAPKVLLALHASMWQVGADVSTNRDPALNIAAQASETGAYFNRFSNGWDLIFVDFSDRDAAYKQLVDKASTWWDESNARLPSFHQAHFWCSQLNQKTRKRLFVWQVPMGNTKMRSCNNTPGHYQDNRVQYYLGQPYGKTHIEELKSCGVIGLLFGAGADDTTTCEDTKADGITNPAPISASNTGTATVADDEGGFLRKSNAAYQFAPVRVK